MDLVHSHSIGAKKTIMLLKISHLSIKCGIHGIFSLNYKKRWTNVWLNWHYIGQGTIWMGHSWYSSAPWFLLSQKYKGQHFTTYKPIMMNGCSSILFHGSKNLGLSTNHESLDKWICIQLSPWIIPHNASTRNSTYISYNFKVVGS
jgi:hypothetical protein